MVVDSKQLMNKLAVVAVALAAYLVVSNVLTSEPARAHNANSEFYLSYMKFQTDPKIRLGNLDWDLDGSQAKRNVTQASANIVKNDISAISGSAFDITSVYWNLAANWTGNACTTAYSNTITVVGSELGSNGTLAKTHYCTGSSSGNIYRTAIRVDPRAWDPGYWVPSNRFDFHGVLMHEVVHATGFGGSWRPDHFFSWDSVCTAGESTRATMCSGYGLGDTWKRSLQAHDIHTIADAY